MFDIITLLNLHKLFLAVRKVPHLIWYSWLYMWLLLSTFSLSSQRSQMLSSTCTRMSALFTVTSSSAISWSFGSPNWTMLATMEGGKKHRPAHHASCQSKTVVCSWSLPIWASVPTLLPTGPKTIQDSGNLFQSVSLLTLLQVSLKRYVMSTVYLLLKFSTSKYSAPLHWCRCNVLYSGIPKRLVPTCCISARASCVSKRLVILWWKLTSNFYQPATPVCIYIYIYLCIHTYHMITSHTLLPCNLALVDFGNLDGCLM